MKKMKRHFYSIKSGFSKIHLIDKCLIIFMIVLLGQSAYGLFFHVNGASEGNTIDVIIRTSTAAIFGYFLSANFIRNSSLTNDGFKTVNPNKTDISPSPDPEGIRNQIGFVANPSSSQDVQDYGYIKDTPVPSKADKTPSTNLQIITAAAVGLFCLGILILVKNTGIIEDNHSATATVAQFRDFISGSVGFLIGCPTGRNDKE